MSDTPSSTEPTPRATRRTFLGWLGAAAGLAVYAARVEPALADANALTQVVPPSRGDKPSPIYILRNESEGVMIVHYARTAATRFDEPVARQSPRTSAEAILLPGEELTITAVLAR